MTKLSLVSLIKAFLVFPIALITLNSRRVYSDELWDSLYSSWKAQVPGEVDPLSLRSIANTNELRQKIPQLCKEKTNRRQRCKINQVSELLIPRQLIISSWSAGGRQAFRYCINRGFNSGFPDGEEAIKNGRRVIGIHCLKDTSRFDVPSDISLQENWGAGGRQAFRYCINRGFSSGFPDGEEAIKNGRRVIGIHCLKDTSRFDVPSDISLF